MIHELTRKAERLLSFWEKDPTNLALIKDILSSFAALSDAGSADRFQSQLDASLREHPQVLWLMAQCHMNSGNLDKAKLLFSELPEDTQGSREYGLAMCEFFAGNFAEAKLSLNKALSRKATNIPPEFNLLMAKSQYHLGELEEAYQTILRQLESNATAEMLGLAAMLAFDLNQIPQANQFADTALNYAPNQHDAMLAKASCLLWQQEYQAAMDLARTGTEQHANSGRFWSVLAQAQLVTQNIPQAQSSAEQALKLMPTHIGTWHIKAWAELILDRIEDAKVSFTSALELNRNFAESHGGLAIVEAHLGHLDDAEKSAKVALRLDPNCYSALYASSLIAKADGDEAHSNQIVQDILGKESHISGITYSQLLSTIINKDN